VHLFVTHDPTHEYLGFFGLASIFEEQNHGENQCAPETAAPEKWKSRLDGSRRHSVLSGVTDP